MDAQIEAKACGWPVGERPSMKPVILLMEEILHQLVCTLSHYLQGFIDPRWFQMFLFSPQTLGDNFDEHIFQLG